MGENSGRTSGAIEPGLFYGLESFKREMKWGDHAMRTARRNGLRVRYLGGRGFVHADDFFAYIDSLDAASPGSEGDDNG